MGKNKARVTKLPEERKQEIIDVAMQVFTEKGYEQATMRDIAAAVGVVPGLCYRYFESKQELFQAALKQYISDYCAPIIQAITKADSLDVLLKEAEALFISRDGKEKYHRFFHEDANKEFNILLSHGICEYMTPYVAELAERFQKDMKINIGDTVSFAQFILYGQIPIINDARLSSEEKVNRIKEYITKIIR